MSFDAFRNRRLAKYAQALQDINRQQRINARGGQRRIHVEGIVDGSTIAIEATASDNRVRIVAGPHVCHARPDEETVRGRFTLPAFVARPTVIVTHPDYHPFVVTLTVDLSLDGPRGTAPTTILATQHKLGQQGQSGPVDDNSDDNSGDDNDDV